MVPPWIPASLCKETSLIELNEKKLAKKKAASKENILSKDNNNTPSLQWKDVVTKVFSETTVEEVQAFTSGGWLKS